MPTHTPGINRFTQIVRFFRVSRLLLWTIWVIYRERKRVMRARARGNYEVKPNVAILIDVLTAFRTTALELGVLMIKLGQFLSSRADILPEQALAVLVALQDEVPPEPFDQVVTMIEAEFGKPVEEIFSVLERKCAAAASLGQVHKAVLAKTGETVAVKVQRTNIDRLVQMDLSTLKFVIWLITRFVNTGNFIDLWGLYREFRRTVYEEIDFAGEATNGQRFREMFQDDPTIYIPRIYTDYVTRRVLVLEWVDGIKINDYSAIDAAGIDRLEVAKRTVASYFHQFFEVGFFHADPHPGNIFIKRGSAPDNPIITFVDFGMVGSVTKRMKRSFKDCFLGVVGRDAHTVVNALNALGFIGEGANLIAIEQAVSLMLDEYLNITLGQFRELDMSDMLQDAVELLYAQPFHIPSQFAFSGRAVSTLVGVTTGLAPNFNFIDVATPYARTFLGLGKDNWQETAQDVLQQLLELSQVMLKLPRSVERMITYIETGQIEVSLANLPMSKGGRGRSKVSVEVSGARGGVALGLAFIGSMGAGIYLMIAHLSAPGWFCLALAAVTVLGILLKR